MKFTSVAPAYCAACYQHDAEARHVDFGGTYDGPVLMLEDGRKQPIDDLVICEKCLIAAFELIDPQGMNERLAAAEATFKEQRQQITERDREITLLRQAIGDSAVAKLPKAKKPRSRKPMTPEQRERAKENLAKARRVAKANRERREREQVEA